LIAKIADFFVHGWLGCFEREEQRVFQDFFAMSRWHL
jgi:hypothetical protein